MRNILIFSYFLTEQKLYQKINLTALHGAKVFYVCLFFFLSLDRFLEGARPSKAKEVLLMTQRKIKKKKKRKFIDIETCGRESSSFSDVFLYN